MSKTILVVDDDPTILMIAEMILKKASYNVICAKSGLEGLANLSQNSVDLLLLDVLMPFMDGLETLKQIREDPKLKTMPVILLTGESDLETVKKAKDLGATDYILKPINQDLLLSKLRQRLG